MKKYTFYQIASLDETIEYMYIGSTIDFIRRKHEHKKTCNNEKNKNYNLPIYKFIRENGNWSNFYIVPIEEAEFETKLQARIHEHQLIEKYKLNSINTYLSEENRINNRKQYRELNKEKIKENMKQYRELNKESNEE